MVTGSRADYGLLRPLLTNLDRNPDCRMSLIATGSHLSHQFGRTIRDSRGRVFNPRGGGVIS